MLFFSVPRGESSNAIYSHTAGRETDSVLYHLNAPGKCTKRNMFDCEPKPNRNPHTPIAFGSRHTANSWCDIFVYICPSMGRRLGMKTANNRQQYPGFACVSHPTTTTMNSIYRLTTFTKCESATESNEKIASRRRALCGCLQRLWQN